MRNGEKMNIPMDFLYFTIYDIYLDILNIFSYFTQITN